ncbi:MAG: N-acetylmuramoyl-L-alanine amidase, partial [Ruminococcaceae bacterium]|nr:N-acetylmuramoyl-L-alanine amidase [Oscillospiraceae bacterium]
MNKKGRLLKKWIIAILCLAVAAFTIPLITTAFLADQEGPVVIVLDPGHGGSDVGAVNYRDGLNEADANLAIALACRDELLKYDGVEVYMTHTGLDKSTRMALGERVACVDTYNADILISLHCNDSSNEAAHGSEVYVSHSQYKDSYNNESTALAVEFLKEFRELGLRIRGVKTRLSNGSRIYYHDNGSVEIGDYYAVIGTTIKRYGVPGILVEHGFVTGDYGYLDSP